MRPKTCKICRIKFQPVRSIQPTCESFDCKLAYGLQTADKAKANRAIKEARAHREAKAKLKTRSDWMKEAQAAFNRAVRAIDAGNPCISCGRHHKGQMHAGHYLSVGSHPELRFNELNVHAQCAPCNNHLSGNIVMYRKGLIAKIGQESVDWLEGPHEAKHYTIEDLKQIKSHYSKLARELEKNQA